MQNNDINTLLIAFVLNKTKEFVIAHPETRLTQTQLKKLKKAQLDYKNGVPLAYILRNKEFYGRDFFVSEDVLIPRPETELLVEQALKYVEGCGKLPINLLEIGSGSGCIPITILAETKQRIHITSIDISSSAIKIARKNAKKLLSPSKYKMLEFVKQDVFSLTPNKTYDLIISNPPYVPVHDYNGLPSSIRNYEPSMAINAGHDGLRFYRKIRGIVDSNLAVNGICLLEIHSTLAKQTQEIFSDIYQTKILKDYQGLPRIIAISRKPY